MSRSEQTTQAPASSAGRTRSVLAVLLPSAALAAAAALWALSLQNLDLRQMSDLGLVSVLPMTYFAALALVTVSFCLALNSREAPEWLLFLHVVLLIVIIHGTPSLSYGTLRYAWAWKHIGMVDYILRHGTVNPDITSLSDLSANHNWPGFFALGALLTEAGGFASALQFAALAPLFFNLIDIGALALIFGALIPDRRPKWLAVWFFFLANWVGQDYFAPQAMAYFLFLVVVGICLTWFSAAPRALTEAAGRWNVLARVEFLWHRLGGPAESRPAPDDQPARAQRVGLMAMIILLFFAVATSHQLTPFMAILSLGALVVAYRCSARSLPVLMAVIAATWMLYVAWAFVGGNLRWIIQTIGQLGRNSTVTSLASHSQDQVLVALAARGLTVAIGWLGAIGFVRRWLLGRRDLAAILLLVAPFPMLVATSYGGEMIFRVYFFALPYAAFFAAALMYPTLASGRSWRTIVALTAVSGVLLSGLLLAYYGRERMNYFTDEEVAAARFLYDTAPPGSLVIGASDNYPSLFQNYEVYTHLALTGQRATQGQLNRLETTPLETIRVIMNDRTYAASYLIITRGQKAQIEMDGLLPPGTIEHVEQLLRQSPDFKIVFENEDAEIFVLASRQGAAR